MSITKTLSDKDMSDEDKLASVAEAVAGARTSYGNTDAKIPSPKVETANGAMGFEHLDAESKVYVLRGEVSRIKAEAVEFSEQNEGVNLNKKIEELVATNGMFTNIDSGVKFELI